MTAGSTRPYWLLSSEELYVARALADLYGSKPGPTSHSNTAKPIRWDTVAADAVAASREYRSRLRGHRYGCQRCNRWFYLPDPDERTESVSCAVQHAPGSCCHYGETEVEAPE